MNFGYKTFCTFIWIYIIWFTDSYYLILRCLVYTLFLGKIHVYFQNLLFRNPYKWMPQFSSWFYDIKLLGIHKSQDCDSYWKSVIWIMDIQGKNKNLPPIIHFSDFHNLICGCPVFHIDFVVSIIQSLDIQKLKYEQN